MKACDYCGRESGDDAVFCRECGTKFEQPEPPGQQHEAEPEVEPSDPVSDVSPSGEYALCSSCLFPNVPHMQWCKRCGAPMNFISTIGPVEAAIATGAVWRGALRGRPKIFVLVSIWFLFLPRLLICLLNIFAAPGIGGFGGVLILALAVFWGVVSAVMLYRVTKNYLTIPKPNLDDTAAAAAL